MLPLPAEAGTVGIPGALLFRHTQPSGLRASLGEPSGSQALQSGPTPQAAMPPLSSKGQLLCITHPQCTDGKTEAETGAVLEGP